MDSGAEPFSAEFRIGSDGETVSLCRVMGGAGRYEEYALAEGASEKARSMLEAFAWDPVAYVEALGDRQSQYSLADHLNHLREIRNTVDIDISESAETRQLLVRSKSGGTETQWVFDKRGPLVQRTKRVGHGERMLTVNELIVVYADSGGIPYPARIDHLVVAPFAEPEIQFWMTATISGFKNGSVIIDSSAIKASCGENALFLSHDERGTLIEELSTRPNPDSSPGQGGTEVSSPARGLQNIPGLLIVSGVTLLAIGTLEMVRISTKRM